LGIREENDEEYSLQNENPAQPLFELPLPIAPPAHAQPDSTFDFAN
jgi:hypothetical protein